MTVGANEGALPAIVGSPISKADCHIGVVPSLGLGDSLIYLIVANNLARAGYRVTLLSNHLAHLAGWLPSIRVLPFPAPEQTQALCEAYDLVLSDCGSIVTSLKQDPAWLAQRCVFVGTLRVKQDYIQDHGERLSARLGADKASLMRALAACAGPIRTINDDSVTMVEQAVEFCRTKLAIQNASPEVGFAVPGEFVARRHQRRVMLHPVSYNAKKNWPYGKYLRLARRLRQQGFDPQFVLSPKERAEWAPRFEAEFAVPQFADTQELAAYLYESGYVIGNDSGVGHLASALGVPVLTIYRKRRDGFCWRPGWGRNEVVRPSISLGAIKHAWMAFLSVSRAQRAFKRLVAKLEVVV
ncbi:glycosyltransferase family 9 protein [Pseudomonas sp. 2FG]|uniref:glycosyltransferase family 9 protein n=1 Tax=Pseudomonas sp. 2FG TaxID=2502191 RepID=UPI0010F8B16D|nr:glycosyltransferase family 9 protein [Pseudomonas sp. 2FG]